MVTAQRLFADRHSIGRGLAAIVAFALPASTQAQTAPLSAARAEFHVPSLTLDPQNETDENAAATAPASAPAEALEDESADAGEDQTSLPLTFDITYYLLSDYVTRGSNWSEFAGEGREKPNHQLTTTLELDIAGMMKRPSGEFGWVTFDTFFEWYAAQAVLNPLGGQQNLQEYDFYIGWWYEIQPIATTFRFQYGLLRYPNTHGIYDSTEVTFALEHNDAWMWTWLLPENEDGVLNPAIFYAYDWDAANRGSWLEFTLSHDFEVVDKVTVTPSFALAADCGYIDGVLDTGKEGKSTVLAYVQYGLTVSYDITELVGFDKWGYGSLLLSGFLYYNQAPSRMERQGMLDDELFGGMSIGWSF